MHVHYACTCMYIELKPITSKNFVGTTLLSAFHDVASDVTPRLYKDFQFHRPCKLYWDVWCSTNYSL